MAVHDFRRGSGEIQRNPAVKWQTLPVIPNLPTAAIAAVGESAAAETSDV